MTTRRALFRQFFSAFTGMSLWGSLAQAKPRPIRYLALPQEDWFAFWNSLPGEQRRFDLTSPLGKKGWVSLYDREWDTYMVLRTLDNRLYPEMIRHAAETGASLRPGRLLGISQEGSATEGCWIYPAERNTTE